MHCILLFSFNTMVDFPYRLRNVTESEYVNEVVMLSYVSQWVQDVCFYFCRHKSQICNEFAAKLSSLWPWVQIPSGGLSNSWDDFPQKVSGTCLKCWHIVLIAFWQIKSIERIIATLEQTIAEGAGQGDEGIRMEIAMLRNERAQLCAGFLGDTWPASQFHGIWQPHLNSTPNFFSSTHY